MNFEKKSSLFPVQHDTNLDAVASHNDDAFAEYSFGNNRGGNHESTRQFVGSTITKRRFLGGTLAILAVFVIFIAKTSALQLIQGEELREQAERNRMYAITLPAQRGVIYDRNGIILAENESVFYIIANLETLPDDVQKQSDLLFSLAYTYNLAVQDLFSVIDNAPTGEFVLAELSHEQAMQFYSENTNTTLHIEATSRRQSITDQIPTLSHVLGYTATLNPEEYSALKQEGYRPFDQIGKQGIEVQYETALRGTFGEELFEIDAYGDLERAYSKTDPIDGENLTLTIDAALQSYVEEVLTSRLAGTPASRASVIVLNPENGEVLALVSSPGYDANPFVEGIDEQSYRDLLENEDNPLFPRAHAGEFPSGSTIKPTFASAALMEGIITASTSFVSTGGVQLGPWFFPDWRVGGHGVTNVYHAIADSVNTFFYLIGGGNETFDGMGIETLMDYAETFGLGIETGIDLPGEADGFLPTKQWKLETIGEQWYIGDTYNASIGQGYTLVTPLQMARNTAIFANGGALVTPHLLIKDTFEPEQVTDEKTISIIREAMRRTVTYGSASYLQGVVVPVAGKTGTAQWSSTQPDHSWFTGFAPYEDPELVITVLIEEGGDRGLAIPVTYDILNWYFAGQ
jgi:penicillin-binding protein 2